MKYLIRNDRCPLVVIFMNLVVFILLLGCSTHKYNTADFACFTYVNTEDDGDETLTLHPDGRFIMHTNKKNDLCCLCNEFEGSWCLEGNIIYLTSLFQAQLNNYIIEHGDFPSNDSVELVIYSFSKNLPTRDYVIFNTHNALLIPDSSGVIRFPCHEVDYVSKRLALDMKDKNGHLLSPQLICGKRYRINIADCQMPIMKKYKLKVKDIHTLYDEFGNIYKSR